MILHLAKRDRALAAVVARCHQLREGVSDEVITVTGCTVIDAFLITDGPQEQEQRTAVPGQTSKLVTLNRRELLVLPSTQLAPRSICIAGSMLTGATRCRGIALRLGRSNSLKVSRSCAFSTGLRVSIVSLDPLGWHSIEVNNPSDVSSIERVSVERGIN
jgi:hypothetical protein